MKAAVLRNVDTPMEIEEVEISKPGPREVLLRVAAVGLCHSDLHIIDGSMPFPMPVILGHEASGIVEQVGADVTTCKPGDHVIVSLTFNCGHCEQCHTGHANRCMTPEAARRADEPARLFHGDERYWQFMNTGSFAEMMLVHESGCVPIDREMPFDRACLIACGVSTGFGAVVNTARVRAGEIVVVIGCGGVGLSAINGAAVAGAGQIIAVDLLPEKMEMARTFGATHIIDASNKDIVSQVRALTDGRGVDHAFECIGRKETIEGAFAMLAKGGTATVVGVARPDIKIEIPPFAFMTEKKIQGSMMGGVRLALDIPRYVDMYMKGQLKLDQLISQRLKLSEVNKGFEDMRRGNVARSVITFDT
jgi:S-(hydroxymethyl)glutathione dehydrogenase / alcohol dehydrogenase